MQAGRGGGGLGAGGAIFIEQGGTLSLSGGTNINFLTDAVTGGIGANPGSAFGGAIFLQGSAAPDALTFAPGAGQTQTVANAIADQTGSGGTGTNNYATGGTGTGNGGTYSGSGSYGLTLNGAGRLVLSATNTYSGGVQLRAGTLELSALQAAGTGAINYQTGSVQTLQLDAAALGASGSAFGNTLADLGGSGGADDGDTLDLRGLSYAASTTTASRASDTLTVTNGTASYTFALSGGASTYLAARDYAGGTAVIAGGQLPAVDLTTTTVTRAEGNAGATAFAYTVTRTGSTAVATTVDYAVTGSGASPTNTSDFTGPTSGTVSFAEGSATAQIVINVAGDTTAEPNEAFTVTLSNAANGTLGSTTTAAGTITDDDAVPPPPPDTTPAGPTTGNDNLVGTAGPDTVSLGLGADTFTGGAGSDVAYGNLGNDLIYGNQGADTLFAGQGDDRAFGGQGDDRLFGNLGNDVLFGNLGADLVYGNQGNDLVYGNRGADLLFGGQGNDVLYGGQDADTLAGGLGDDTLVGGLGADLYRLDPNSGRDLILGFNPGEGDRIALGGQTYTISSAQNGDARLTLSGGGVVDLAGIRADQVDASVFTA